MKNCGSNIVRESVVDALRGPRHDSIALVLGVSDDDGLRGTLLARSNQQLCHHPPLNEKMNNQAARRTGPGAREQRGDGNDVTTQ